MADRKRGRDELDAAGSGWTRNGGAGARTRPHNRQPGHLPSTAVLAQRAATGTYLSATVFVVLQPPLRPTSSP
ncbi:hypothetical protein KL918_003806 [Ogataea parapolymorpha]|nr:hypothetical protein KL918_003806 [Ogataea parapolymorpha]KAG7872969.1 hypothetical protein KL916_002699 [Ogataea parapolymorpha]